MTAIDQCALLRSVLAEYLAGNRIINGHWHAPDEGGDPHYINHPATPQQLALIASIRQEYQLP